MENFQFILYLSLFDVFVGVRIHKSASTYMKFGTLMRQWIVQINPMPFVGLQVTFEKSERS